jgi:hypothetical protein
MAEKEYSTDMTAHHYNSPGAAGSLTGQHHWGYVEAYVSKLEVIFCVFLAEK